MRNIFIYHGSEKIIEKPFYKGGNQFNDFGYGFYCTKDIELAKEWASKDSNRGYVNKYKINLEDLKILDLTSNQYSVLNWIAILLKNRTFSVTSKLPLEIKNYLIKEYLIDISCYDVIIGYRADDSYFAYANAFINNTLSLDELEKSIKLGKLGKQIVIISKSAFESLKFEGYEEINSNYYHLKRMVRDSSARINFKSIKKSSANTINSIYAIDIVRKKGIKNEN